MKKKFNYYNVFDDVNFIIKLTCQNNFVTIL